MKYFFKYFFFFVVAIFGFAQISFADSFSNTLHAPTYAVSYDDSSGGLTNIDLPFPSDSTFHYYCFANEDNMAGFTLSSDLTVAGSVLCWRVWRL